MRADTALSFISTLLKATTDSTAVHDVQLRFFGKTLKSYPDVTSYLLHEYMETDNVPFYFSAFANDVEDHDLQYICDADQADFELDSLPPDAAAEFEKVSHNAIEVEQYIDFLKNTCFRRSLVCHAGLAVNSDYRLERLERLYAATNAVPILDSPDSPLQEATAFKTPTGRQFSTQHEFAQIILRWLSDIRPCSMPVGSLIEAVANESALESKPGIHKQAEKIGHAVYSLFYNGVLELMGTGRQCVLNIGNFPKASPVSRVLAPLGHVTNLCHRTIVMDDDMACFVLAHLDGTRNRDTLCDLMAKAVRTGQVRIPSLNTKNIDEIRMSMRDKLGKILQQLPRCGVLIKN